MDKFLNGFTKPRRRRGHNSCSARVLRRVERDGAAIARVRYEADGREHTISATRVWSTLPINLLVRSMSPRPPSEIFEAAGRISFRGMILNLLDARTGSLY